MSDSNLQTALREADRAAKKQKTCANKSADAVAALQQHLQAVRQQVGWLGHTGMFEDASKHVSFS